MSVEDEFQKILGAYAAASSQLNSEMENVAALLGAFRRMLIKQNDFTTEGAEDLVLEWFSRLLDGPSSSEDDD